MKVARAPASAVVGEHLQLQTAARCVPNWFDIPESGRWALNAECGATSYAVEPMTVDIRATGPDPVIDVRLVK